MPAYGVGVEGLKSKKHLFYVIAQHSDRHIFLVALGAVPALQINRNNSNPKTKREVTLPLVEGELEGVITAIFQL